MVVAKKFVGVQINKEGLMVADQMLIEGQVTRMGNCGEDVRGADCIINAS